MSNIFDDPKGRFFVLVNAEGQHALWPEFLDAPDGWSTAHGPAERTSCTDYINVHWTDMRPLSLVAHLERVASEQPRKDALR
ncbi:MbtH family protein [Streptomyces xanthochromogenes]|uniref:MbtH family protein n=1 Tax=Streptomyces xanthochromogenes TaxID=67384 RepID=UPI0037FF3FE2